MTLFLTRPSRQTAPARYRCEIIMRILLVHERYQQRGGEDAVADAEAKLLERNGHGVSYYSRNNDELRGHGLLETISAGVDTVWASKAFREIDDVIEKHKPEVAHFHNTFPMISPSAYYACARRGIPVVQTLHNYRLVCPGATFLREGKVCEECLGKGMAWRAVAHACYRGSRPASAAVAAMLAAHRVLRTWQTKVDAYVALSEFARGKFISGGLPRQRMVVKPNFVHPDPGTSQTQQPGRYGLFVGRLSEEKGLRGLLASWRHLARAIPLFILGDGPMRQEIATEIRESGLTQVTLVGSVSRDEVFRWMRGAAFLVCPSHWFEGCPLVIVEAFACSVPVIATGHGPTAEMVAHGCTGLHVAPGDDADLAAKVEWAWAHRAEMETMRRAARREFEEKYTAERNYGQLVSLYKTLILGKPVGSQQAVLTAVAGGGVQ
jgi:glycosyltransferase involved in cell wall biosynthesis